MNKINIAFIIILYITSAYMLKIPYEVHIVFAVVLLIVLLCAAVLKYQSEYENEKIVEIATKAQIASLICFFIYIIYEMLTSVEMINNTIWFILIIGLEFVKWFFKKKR